MSLTRKFSAVLTAASFGVGCNLPQRTGPISPHEQSSRPAHNPNEDYTALVYCLDTSKSPLPYEFNTLKGLVRGTVAEDVDSNDLIWVVRIEDQLSQAKLFSMPPRGYTRLERQRSADQLREAKGELVRHVEALQQMAGKTDLKNAIELALNILNDQPAAKRKVLIIVSDFVQDSGKRVTSAPPDPAEGLSAKDVEVALLLLYPKNEYLRTLGISANELHKSVSEEWTAYFNRLGARKSVASLADAVPFAQQGEVN